LLCHQTSPMPCILVNYTFNSTSERQRGKKWILKWSGNIVGIGVIILCEF
jgi:hypothetical protein